MASRAQIHITAAGTQVLVAAAAGKSVKVRRVFLCASGAGTVDFQDTGGTSLDGGPLTVAAATQFFMNYSSPEDAIINPFFWTTVGLGFQIVTTGAITFNGFIDYDQL